MFSLESPNRGDTNEYTQYTIFNIKKCKLPKVFLNLQRWDFFQGTQVRVRNSHCKRAFSVRAIEGLLNVVCCFVYYWYNVCDVKSYANIKSRKKGKTTFFELGRMRQRKEGGGPRISSVVPKI